MRKKRTIQTFKPIEQNNNALSYSPIVWKGDSIGGRWVDKVAFDIPVTLNHLSKTFYMQFDLGAPKSMLYGNPLYSIAREHPQIEKNLSTINNKLYLKDVHFIINDKSLVADSIPVRKDLGEKNIDTSFVNLGTIGYDIIYDKKLILDFKKDRFALVYEFPNEIIKDAKFIDETDISKFPIILPFQLGNKKIRLMFDTGSSMFPILTAITRVRKLAKEKEIQKLCCIDAWGKSYPVYKAPKVHELVLGDINFGKIDVYGYKSMNITKWLGNYLYGLTGNVLFQDHIILIDRKNNRFGIIK